MLTPELFSTTLALDMERPFHDSILCGDARILLTKLPSDSVDLIVTSPPYADRRSKTYGGIKPDAYVQWFLPIAEQLHRVLRPTGSFVLNIKEIVVNGERHTYVIELILEMRKRGWLWTEDYVWHKRNCYPGKWPNRFRDAWERCLHFTKNRKFSMHQEAVMVPMGDWRHARLRNLSETDKMRDNSHVNSGFGKNVSNWVNREFAYPTNVLHLATECGNKNHSAAFPISLPSWFIKLFTRKGDVVLDPFLGSGTTAVAARDLGRHYIGIDIDAEFCHIARQRVQGIRTEKNKARAQHTSRRVGTPHQRVPSLFLQASNSRA
jgi:site-specific DNA-methyltransferase (adenine-specific)